MNRIGMMVLGMAVMLPVAVQAQQRPGATVQTRSAELYLQTALEKQQGHPEEQMKLYKKALDLSLQAIQSAPGNPKTWFTLGEVYTEMGDAMGADTAFDKAEQLWPDYVKETDKLRIRAYAMAFNAGVQSIQANKPAEAIKNLEGAMAVYDKRPATPLNLANLYAKLNDNAKAVASYRRALEILRGPERKTLKADEEKQWAQWEEAAAFNLAQLLALSDNNADAAKAYEDYLAHSPNNITAKSNLAVIYTRLGKKADAERMYKDLLAQDLSDEDYFIVGVGLFRADQHASAAEAFRKAIAKNQVNRDAYYNLAQALYSQIGVIEDARSKAKLADQKNFDTQLKPLYTELIATAEKARTQDPNNRNVLALLARGYRGMADVVDAKTAMEWKNKTLAVMTTHQEMPLEVTDVQLVSANGEAKLTGNVVNLKAKEGDALKLKVTFLGKDGKELGDQEVTVTAPKTEDQVAFTATLKTADAVGGWRYAISK